MKAGWWTMTHALALECLMKPIALWTAHARCLTRSFLKPWKSASDLSGSCACLHRLQDASYRHCWRCHCRHHRQHQHHCPFCCFMRCASKISDRHSSHGVQPHLPASEWTRLIPAGVNSPDRGGWESVCSCPAAQPRLPALEWTRLIPAGVNSPDWGGWESVCGSAMQPRLPVLRWTRLIPAGVNSPYWGGWESVCVVFQACLPWNGQG